MLGKKKAKKQGNQEGIQERKDSAKEPLISDNRDQESRGKHHYSPKILSSSDSHSVETSAVQYQDALNQSVFQGDQAGKPFSQRPPLPFGFPQYEMSPSHKASFEDLQPPQWFYSPYPYGPYGPYGYPGQKMHGFPPASGSVPPLGDMHSEAFLEPLRTDAQKSLIMGNSHWRNDLKWLFGLISALFLFFALSTAGVWRVTAYRNAKQVLVPLIQGATRVSTEVRDSYLTLKKRAKKNPYGKVSLEFIGIETSLDSKTVISSEPEELSELIIFKIADDLYSKGLRNALPMPRAYGVGEERDKALCLTFLSKINRGTHENVLVPLIVFAGLALGFCFLSAIFSEGWGKASTIGIISIAGSLPGSLVIRAACEFLWRPGAGGVFRIASSQALNSTGMFALPFYDIALAFGAIVLLVGIIGGIVRKRSLERIPPFLELELGGDLNSAQDRQSANASQAESDLSKNRESS